MFYFGSGGGCVHPVLCAECCMSLDCSLLFAPSGFSRVYFNNSAAILLEKT